MLKSFHEKVACNLENQEKMVILTKKKKFGTIWKIPEKVYFGKDFLIAERKVKENVFMSLSVKLRELFETICPRNYCFCLKLAFQVIPNSCLYWAIDLILYKQVSLSRLYLVINLFLFYLLNRQVKPSHFWQMFPFYTHWKHQKILGFLVFSGGIKWKHWPEMC